MGTLPIVKNYNTAPPINPATNKAWTMPDYLRATNAIGAAVQAQLGVPATANGLAGGRGYWRSAAPTSGMLDVYDAAQAEIWMRTAGVAPVTAWPSLAEWKQHVDMLVDLGSKGRVAMVTTKLLTSATPPSRTSGTCSRWPASRSALMGTAGTTSRPRRASRVWRR
jgi:hypothetical protein